MKLLKFAAEKLTLPMKIALHPQLLRWLKVSISDQSQMHFRESPIYFTKLLVMVKCHLQYGTKMTTRKVIAVNTNEGENEASLPEPGRSKHLQYDTIK